MYGIVTHEVIRRVLDSLNSHNPHLGLKVYFQFDASKLSYILTYTDRENQIIDLTRQVSPIQLYNFLMNIWLQGYKTGYISAKKETITI